MDRKAQDREWSDLMRVAIGGDNGAYQRLLSDLSRALRMIVRRGFSGVSARPNEVEDVVQEVLLAVHLKRHTWDQSKPISPWIMAIARNKMIDDLRRKGRRTEVPIDGMLGLLDAGGHVMSWNPGAEKFKGYTADEVMGSHFSRFYTPEDKAKGLPDQALSTARTEGRFENEGWRVRKDGTRFWAHVVIDPVIGPDGSTIGYAKVTRDLT
ncbi:MAG: PAS domain S-box protein, partial [Hyphomicrobium sp.]